MKISSSCWEELCSFYKVKRVLCFHNTTEVYDSHFSKIFLLKKLPLILLKEGFTYPKCNHLNVTHFASPYI